MDEVAPATGADATRPARSRRLALIAGVLLLAVAIAAVVLLVRQDDVDADADVREVSAAFGEHLLTFDPDRPEAGVEGVLDRSAGAFADSYRQAVDAGLVEVLLEAGTRSRARAQEVLVGPVERGRVAVFVDLLVRRTSPGEAEIEFSAYLRLELVDGDRGWAVEDVTSLEESRRAVDLTPADNVDDSEVPTEDGG